ncbi:hypothetical protein [Actinomadura rayongensis]|uniref:hypothetical protein n=1 Tax=Actinomadura rayongensis TaxID=1429076 RepID=UPI00301CDA02
MAAGRAAQPVLTARLAAIGVLILVAAALGVYVAVVGLRVKDGSDSATQRDRAVQAARQLGVNLNTLDYQNGQRDIDRIVAGTTGKLKDQLAGQSKALLDRLTQTKARTTVSDPQAAVVSIDDDSAEIMVSMNATVTNEKVKNAAPQYWRLLMDLDRHGDRWLVSNMEMVP